ncbi:MULTISPECIES: phosphate ABC transporter substrate-binding protein PstS [unclassified Rudaea]|uniref:phosphate ABC transporter substrate-binding protein PstS n=1 Tax=unclassified Rudaea TaxID=2627037 RepID=UPI0010F5CF6D|nr:MULTISPECIES: phosphate ABC transporter substrate-binding protein PstS [unclassified Rudaea]
MFHRIRHSLTAFAVAATLFAGSAQAVDITGAGSTFVQPIITKWSASYADKSGSHINYGGGGSGAGIAQIKAATIDFGASDKPLSPEELSAAGLGQFPIVIGGVVPVVNIEGIKAGDVKLTGAQLGDIYLGKIKKWNDPALAANNPGVKLPDVAIQAVYRSDGSGTTFNYTNYLSKVSTEWKEKIGEGTTVQWPVGVGGKGNAGVAAYVQQINGSVGYVELAYALQNKMAYTQLQNSAGKFITPNLASFAAAASHADWKSAKDFQLVITNAPGDDSWPITATAFALVYKTPKDAARSKAVVDFFKYAYTEGGKQAEALDYVPLPAALVQQIEAYWKAEVKL